MSTLLASVSSDDFGDAKKVADELALDIERAFNVRTFIDGSSWPSYRIYSTETAPAGAVSFARHLAASAKENEAAHRARSARFAAERTERKRASRARVRPYGKGDV